MKIASEAELIEIQNRAASLAAVAEYLDKRIETAEVKAENADNEWEEARYQAIVLRLTRQFNAVVCLESDISILVEAVRQLRPQESRR